MKRFEVNFDSVPQCHRTPGYRPCIQMPTLCQSTSSVQCTIYFLWTLNTYVQTTPSIWEPKGWARPFQQSCFTAKTMMQRSVNSEALRFFKWARQAETGGHKGPCSRAQTHTHTLAPHTLANSLLKAAVNHED